MINLFNFFLEGETPTGNGASTWIIMGLLIVAVIFMMVIPQRRNKKRAEEMMSKLCVGSTITTIGGIIGEVIEMNEQHIWISTGTEGSKTTMQFLRGAIHSIAPAPGSPEAVAAEEAAKAKEDQVDEIR